MFLILYVIGSYVTCLQVEITFFLRRHFFLVTKYPGGILSRRHFFQEAFFFPDSVCPTFFGNVLGEEVSSERVH